MLPLLLLLLFANVVVLFEVGTCVGERVEMNIGEEEDCLLVGLKEGDLKEEGDGGEGSGEGAREGRRDGTMEVVEGFIVCEETGLLLVFVVGVDVEGE